MNGNKPTALVPALYPNFPGRQGREVAFSPKRARFFKKTPFFFGKIATRARFYAHNLAAFLASVHYFSSKN